MGQDVEVLVQDTRSNALRGIIITHVSPSKAGLRGVLFTAETQIHLHERLSEEQEVQYLCKPHTSRDHTIVLAVAGLLCRKGRNVILWSMHKIPEYSGSF